MFYGLKRRDRKNQRTSQRRNTRASGQKNGPIIDMTGPSMLADREHCNVAKALLLLRLLRRLPLQLPLLAQLSRLLRKRH
jgi:hypothetical protein